MDLFRFHVGSYVDAYEKGEPRLVVSSSQTSALSSLYSGAKSAKAIMRPRQRLREILFDAKGSCLKRQQRESARRKLD